MGGNSSAPSPPPAPPPSPLLRTAWREITWGGNRVSLQYLKNFQPHNGEAAIRVLLYGPVGVGKSSFINSVNNVLQGRMTSEALASATTSDQSFTKIYKTHKIRKDRGNFYPFVFNDIMGLEDGDGRGVRAEDIKLALKGHVKDGYKFNPVCSLCDGDFGYNSSPSISDRVHVLVCIYSANAPQMNSSVLQKMKEIREAASELEIPQLAILTHVDAACGETEENLKNVYKSKHLKKKMGDFSSSLGIPMNCIFPVKNYSHETQLNSDVDTLILNALRLMIDFGDDYADKL
ncbi:interferon-induced protein 44-like isoform X2 [Xiphophorus hellerii]|uniref:interferon-induced protein 44-like isoform X2 n=1 Tax=Xiphophorus hellerii TaxID=8084 RepID=UPI0013B3F170|nr:interferon-induced protein 44-like isoform X2 [Xiphophorus hellerii]